MRASCSVAWQQHGQRRAPPHRASARDVFAPQQRRQQVLGPHLVVDLRVQRVPLRGELGDLAVLALDGLGQLLRELLVRLLEHIDLVLQADDAHLG